MSWSHRSLALTSALSVLVLAFAVGLAHSPAAGAAVGCDRVAAPNGSDSAPGTEAAPLRTAQRLVDSLSPGQTGCLRGGTYSADQTKVRKPNVTLTSYPSERATLRGQLRFEATADGATVEGLTLDGRNRQNKASPLIYADDVVVRGNDISNAHGDSSCVLISRYYDAPAPQGVVIDQNRIHDCGELPATNQHHGIYLSAGRGTLIRDNWIYSSADRGIQLYPDADGTTIRGNVIDGNGQGIIFGSNDKTSPDDNLVVGNAITNSTIRYNVQSHSQGAPYGRDNVVRGNCIHGGAYDDGDGGIQSPEKGFTATDNLLRDPQYVDRGDDDFRLRPDSPCADLLGGSGVVPSDDPPVTDPELTLATSRTAADRGDLVRLSGRAVVNASTVQVLRSGADGWRLVDRVPVRDRRYAVSARINRRNVNTFVARADGIASDPVSVRSR